MNTAALPSDRRAGLLAALHQIGGDDPGERAAAGLELAVALQSTGLEWKDVIIGAPVLEPAAPPAAATDWRANWTLCRHRLGFLQACERNFVATLAGIAGRPTRKQGVVLAEIAASLRTRGLK